jgi:hypothetical protein
MKLTKDGKTLFVALCDLFINKVGATVNRRALGDHSTLIATRNTEGVITNIDLQFRKNKTDVITLLTIEPEQNQVLLDATAWLTKATINRFNKILSLVELNIKKQNGLYYIHDKTGQAAPFRNGEFLNLERPHGSAIYATVEAQPEVVN